MRTPAQHDDRPHAQRRIDNLRAIAEDKSVNNFARAICAEAALYLSELSATSAAETPRYGAIVCKTGD